MLTLTGAETEGSWKTGLGIGRKCRVYGRLGKGGSRCLSGSGASKGGSSVAGVRTGVPSPVGCHPPWAATMELSAEYLREKLQRDLEAEHVEVEDTTPNRCASSFRVLVVSAKFEGKPLLQRHRFPGPGELVTTRKSASLGGPNIASCPSYRGQAQAEATDKAQAAAARCRKGSELDGKTVS
ncbi:bolA-like protein 2 isoform X2 [Bubalus kerabau]|uniref:bolA-like protein 2 isoform X2 n=1 Tax=Bubalus carabanensis TaxID=3119969 RepID=UPI00244E6003|nr:bolA-like protein 2 isoform X2 [Bubalus carabanensis]